jgi:hypothetical protein
MNNELKEWEREVYTDDEINKLAEWFQDLTVAQLSFLKESYATMLQAQARECGQDYVH